MEQAGSMQSNRARESRRHLERVAGRFRDWKDETVMIPRQLGKLFVGCPLLFATALSACWENAMPTEAKQPAFRDAFIFHTMEFHDVEFIRASDRSAFSRHYL